MLKIRIECSFKYRNFCQIFLLKMRFVRKFLLSIPIILPTLDLKMQFETVAQRQLQSSLNGLKFKSKMEYKLPTSSYDANGRRVETLSEANRADQALNECISWFRISSVMCVRGIKIFWWETPKVQKSMPLNNATNHFPLYVMMWEL